MGEIEDISKKIDYNNLSYHFKDLHSPLINFIKLKGPFGFFDKIKNDDILLKDAEKSQENFKRSLGQITSGNPKHKEKYQLDAIKNIKNLYDSRQKIIYLFNDYSKIRSESIHKSKQDETKGTGLTMLTPKQMLQRLLIALTQVKTGNNSKSLLNEIRQIVKNKSLKKYTIT